MSCIFGKCVNWMKSVGYPDTFWIVWTVSRWAGKFLDYPDRFWIVPKVSRLSGNLKKCTHQCALPLRLMPGCCLQPLWYPWSQIRYSPGCWGKLYSHIFNPMYKSQVSIDWLGCGGSMNQNFVWGDVARVCCHCTAPISVIICYLTSPRIWSIPFSKVFRMWQ